MTSRAIKLIQGRVAERAWGDVAYALQTLREADPEIARGRVAQLQDLIRRAETAESTMDPQDVQNLIQALTTFLDAALADALNAERRAQTSPQQEAQSPAARLFAESLSGDAHAARLRGLSATEIFETSLKRLTESERSFSCCIHTRRVNATP